LFFNLHNKTVYLFEPHGSDPMAKGHSPTFRGYYNPAQYYPMMAQALGNVLGHKWVIKTPDSYEPSVFGQSRSNITEHGGDRWCALWTLLFVIEATFGSPVQFVRMIDEKTRAGILNEYVKTMLTTWKHWMTTEFLDTRQAEVITID
jgi:hypothetical protein